MIRFIAAIDKNYGLADDKGIPWQGKLPTDVRYYHEKIKGAPITLVGYGMYTELSKPLVNKINHVASKRGTNLKDGFILVNDAEAFLRSATADVWVLGGAALFSSTLHLADELYLTRIKANLNCTKFFPSFEADFTLTQEESPLVENGIKFNFQVWTRKDSAQVKQ